MTSRTLDCILARCNQRRRQKTRLFVVLAIFAAVVVVGVDVVVVVVVVARDKLYHFIHHTYATSRTMIIFSRILGVSLVLGGPKVAEMRRDDKKEGKKLTLLHELARVSCVADSTESAVIFANLHHDDHHYRHPDETDNDQHD